MVLLTSSQVSVAISSFIVFLFTSALFLSGYVLQQKTVNDIREAIKPQIAPLKPGLYLPPQFRSDEFWDGKEVVIVNQENNARHKQEGEEQSEGKAEARDIADGDESMIGATRWQKAKKLKEKERSKEQSTPEEAAKKITKPKKAVKGKVVGDEPLSAVERRKKIKEEVLAAGEGEGFKGYRRRMW